MLYERYFGLTWMYVCMWEGATVVTVRACWHITVNVLHGHTYPWLQAAFESENSLWPGLHCMRMRLHYPGSNPI